jgi:hypothetical protein
MSDHPLIVTFSDWNYQPILENWLTRLGGLGIGGARVYCLDQQTLDWCRERAVDAELLVWDGRGSSLWKLRLGVFSGLIDAGIPFVHSDSDAVWVADPFAVGGSADQPEDLVFSQGTFWPPQTFEDWGFVLCCGWFSVKPSLASRAFFRDLVDHVATTGDDQVSVNRLLQQRNIRWDARPADYTIVANNQAIRCWHDPYHGRSADGSLGVVLLPHAEYQRLPIATEVAVVKHFLTPKRRDDKIAMLRRVGLWRLA